MNIKFSVVINTYNRGNLLNDALLGLSELTYDNYEIVVVNGPSTDQTESVLELWRDKIKIGKCDKPNLSMSRNIGIEMSAGDVVAFIDDDAVPHPQWLNHLASHYSDPRVGGVGGYTIDNTGEAFQVRKTVCDRYGNAYFPSDFFDLAPLTFPGSPIFPSLLGTNSSFRRSALQEISGFDHAYAYLLDETDVCLRLIDKGYKVIYEPEALVYHQFAPSHIRNKKRIAKTLYPSAVSKSYFIQCHGETKEVSRELQRYENEILTANKWLADHGDITQDHKVFLDDDILFGIKDGTQKALKKIALHDTPIGDMDLTFVPSQFLPMEKKSGLRIVLISKSFPPNHEAGIARWTWMMASGLAKKGHKVHVVTLAEERPYTKYENGYWLHGICEDQSESVLRNAAYWDIPEGVSKWCTAVKNKVNLLKSFGIDAVSFPIWDVEGIGLLDDKSLPLVMSLHTTYAMAKPFKPEWLERPIFGKLHVDRVISAEKKLLQHVPNILANSQAIIDDLIETYSVNFDDRVILAPHGTLDPMLQSKEIEQSGLIAENTAPFKIIYVGRFEPRKGFDIACNAFSLLLSELTNVEITFIGDTLSESITQLITEIGADNLLTDKRVKFFGLASRRQLDAAYIAADVVVMPSRYESFGLVAIEAMAAGTPVIALASGGLKEVITDGASGLLIDPEDRPAQKIAEKLNYLANNPRVLSLMKAAARREFSESYTVERMVDAAEIVYRKAAKEKSYVAEC